MVNVERTSGDQMKWMIKINRYKYNTQNKSNYIVMHNMHRVGESDILLQHQCLLLPETFDVYVFIYLLKSFSSLLHILNHQI